MSAPNLEWIKELVRNEQQMEEAGVVDFSPAFDPANVLLKESILFLKQLKENYLESCSYFNQLKPQSKGHIKIYAISKTHADFMLFRNGCKLIFSMTEPGKIVVQFHHPASQFHADPTGVEASASVKGQSTLESNWGAFGEVQWHYKDKPVNFEYLVKYFLKHFVHNSSN